MLVDELRKLQDIRTFDVWLTGPAMIIGGRCLGGGMGTLLKLLGYGTIVYNGMNHYRQAKQFIERV